MLLRLAAQFRAQLRQIAPHRELPPMLVHDLEIHEKMRRQGLELEVGLLHRDLGLLANIGDQRLQQATRTEARTTRAVDKTSRIFRQRHTMTP
jgi:hypothetical protein